MSILILTVPAGAGKNTIAELIAKQKERCAVIDVDLVRWMVLQPHKAPWDGEEGKRQQMLGVENAILLVKKFAANGYDVVIHDVLTNETAHMYREGLKELGCKIVLLLPTLEETKRRNAVRPLRITNDEIALLYKWQEELTYYDEKIDNTELPAKDVAQRLAF